MTKEQGITGGYKAIKAMSGNWLVMSLGSGGYVARSMSEQKAKFFATALNQCQSINPSHPEYVAEGIGEMWAKLWDARAWLDMDKHITAKQLARRIDALIIDIERKE